MCLAPLIHYAPFVLALVDATQSTIQFIIVERLVCAIVAPHAPAVTFTGWTSAWRFVTGPDRQVVTLVLAVRQQLIDCSLVHGLSTPPTNCRTEHATRCVSDEVDVSR